MVEHSGKEFKIDYKAKVDEEGDVLDMHYDLPNNFLEALAMPVTEQIQVKIMEDINRWKR